MSTVSRSPIRIDRTQAALATIQDLPEGSATVEDLRIVGALASAEGVTLADCVPMRRCVVMLARLLSGESWAGALACAGLQWVHVGIMARADPDGFGRLVTHAEGAKDAIFRRAARDELHRRAITGVDEPVFGAVGLGVTGIVGHKRRYSDHLLEFGLSKLDKPTFGDPREIAANVQIGQQIVYNITGLHIGDQTAAPSAPASTNGDDPSSNPAEIDVEALEIE